MLWHVKSFHDGSLARYDVKAAICYGGMLCKRLCYGATAQGPLLQQQHCILSSEPLIFSVCVDAAGYRSIQLRRGGCYPRPTSCMQQPQRHHGRTFVLNYYHLLRGVRKYKLWLYNRFHTGVHSCASTTISEGGVWGHMRIWLYDDAYDDAHKGFSRRALLVAAKGNGLLPN